MTKLLNLTKTERRLIIVLMIINSFALFVNYFDLNPYFGDEKRYYLLTDGIDKMTTRKFYPFTSFSENSYNYGDYAEFRGIFPDYDLSEFFVYTLLIYGFIIVKKIW